ncbi:MAG: type II secretion system protein [Bacteroidia bacterium]|nr:type II secretion system protein [Bacteroidia bacterium]
MFRKIIFNETGFTLIEMVMVIAIVGFAFAGIAMLFTGVILTRNANEKLIQATTLAEKKMEYYRNQPYSYIANTLPSATSEIIPGFTIFTISTKKQADGSDGYLIDVTVTWDEPLRNKKISPSPTPLTYSVVSCFINGGLNKYVTNQD